MIFREFLKYKRYDDCYFRMGFCSFQWCCSFIIWFINIPIQVDILWHIQQWGIEISTFTSISNLEKSIWYYLAFTFGWHAFFLKENCCVPVEWVGSISKLLKPLLKKSLRLGDNHSELFQDFVKNKKVSISRASIITYCIYLARLTSAEQELGFNEHFKRINLISKGNREIL